jgi:L-alanine-DL-glutamate epimerase-like enolase superfamily enzyme
VRKTFGDGITLYADANSSYDVPHAVRIGRMLEEYNYGMYEEPCPFDHLDETRQISKALSIPVSGGEQESSQWRFRDMIGRRVVDVVQPDLHYYGGLIRSMRVARMAHAAGMPCIPHLSGSGLGYLDLAHFVSCIPNPGPHQEFKGNTRLPVHCDTALLKCKDGIVQIPSGPGCGITIDPDYVRKAQKVTTI